MPLSKKSKIANIITNESGIIKESFTRTATITRVDARLKDMSKSRLSDKFEEIKHMDKAQKDFNDLQQKVKEYEKNKAINRQQLEEQAGIVEQRFKQHLGLGDNQVVSYVSSDNQVVVHTNELGFSPSERVSLTKMHKTWETNDFEN